MKVINNILELALSIALCFVCVELMGFENFIITVVACMIYKTNN